MISRWSMGALWGLLLLGACAQRTPAGGPAPASSDLAACILDLSSETFDVRDRAAEALIAAGERALPALEALASAPGADPEALDQARRIRSRIHGALQGITIDEQLRLSKLLAASDLAAIVEVTKVSHSGISGTGIEMVVCSGGLRRILKGREASVGIRFHLTLSNNPSPFRPILDSDRSNPFREGARFLLLLRGRTELGGNETIWSSSPRGSDGDPWYSFVTEKETAWWPEDSPAARFIAAVAAIR